MGATKCLPPLVLRLVQALAEDEARKDYLAAQASRNAAAGDQRTKPVPLPATDRAA